MDKIINVGEFTNKATKNREKEISQIADALIDELEKSESKETKKESLKDALMAIVSISGIATIDALEQIKKSQ